jgi:hypothetical protein
MLPTEPGIYTDVTREEYDSIEAMNNSTLSEGLSSMAALKAKIDGERFRETDAMKFGRAYHCLVLEPKEFAKRYALAPLGTNANGQASRSTKEGKAAWAEWEEEYPGREPISPEDWDTMMAMKASLMSHKAARSLLSAPADYEVTVLWYDRDTAELCKCRIDVLPKDRKGVLDLKSAKSAAAHHFEKAILDYGYHRQSAMYCDGVHAITEQEYPGFYIIAQEKVAPYLVGVYLIDDNAVDYGRYQYTRLLAAYSEATLTNEWPGYSDRVQVIGLPRHAMAKARQEMEVASELLG